MTARVELEDVGRYAPPERFAQRQPEAPTGPSFGKVSSAITTAAALLTLGASAALWGVRGRVDAVEKDQRAASIGQAVLAENVKSLAEAMRDLREELREQRKDREKRGGK